MEIIKYTFFKNPLRFNRIYINQFETLLKIINSKHFTIQINAAYFNESFQNFLS